VISLEISKILLEEILKLNKSEWNRLKIGVDYLYALEVKKNEKNIFLNSNNVEDNLKCCPTPILLQFE